ncbi:MAG: GTPase ObgE [Bacteroidetes bacterium]|nr:GTPase ObgE [Bacteroidota bacterium]MBL6963302.1 GTPase ObgE [Bacteroidota bacterium]
MSNQNFIDQIKIYCRSGAGGPGSVHFHRDKLTAKGGPDGGDGGRGGHVILKGNKNLWTLLHLRYQKHILAKNGQAGMGLHKTGADAADMVIEVPLGTIARDFETDELLIEITEDSQEGILLKGGQGGLGNIHFKSSTRQAPQYAQPGIPGIEKTVILELKLLADVGLVGLPNVGKSTLLSVISAAKPKIANYEFTTLTPQVGVVNYRDYQSFVVADIPGIIKGASAGKGLGTQFLRHIERNSILLFMASAENLNINDQYLTLLTELEKFNPSLLMKKRLLAITKSDLLDEELKEEIRKSVPQIPYLFISSVSTQGIIELKDLLWKMLNPEVDF